MPVIDLPTAAATRVAAVEIKELEDAKDTAGLEEWIQEHRWGAQGTRHWHAAHGTGMQHTALVLAVVTHLYQAAEFVVLRRTFILGFQCDESEMSLSRLVKGDKTMQSPA